MMACGSDMAVCVCVLGVLQSLHCAGVELGDEVCVLVTEGRERIQGSEGGECDVWVWTWVLDGCVVLKEGEEEGNVRW